MTAARNGCRFAKSDAREGPTRSIAVNQSRFVTTSGPTTAKAKPTQTSAPKWNSWCASWRAPTAQSSSAAAGRNAALRRKGEYRRIRGEMQTEYAAHEAEPPTASASPLRSDESDPPSPSATRATPAKDTSAAIQKRRLWRSTPAPRANKAVQIGKVPKSSATVVAVVKWSA